MVDLLAGGITFCGDPLGSPCEKRTIGGFVMSEVKRYDSYLRDGVVHFEADPEGAWMPSDDVQSELTALREELAIVSGQRDEWKRITKNMLETKMATYERMTAAERRNMELVELLKGYPRGVPGFAAWADKVTAALKPTESGASE